MFCELRHSVRFWRQLQTLLFGLFWEEEAASLLFHTSPFFKYAVNECLLREVLLNAARLTDPAASGGGIDKANLSFARLLDEVKAASSHDLAARISSAVAEITLAAADIHKLRSKVLAHADLTTATAASPPPLPDLPREHFVALLDQMVRVLQEVERHYTGSADGYDDDVADRAVNQVVTTLRRANL